jgi:hypothetical protein
MDGQSHSIINNPYYKLEYKASIDAQLGSGNLLNSIVISNGRPTISLSLLNTLSSGESIANELKLDIDANHLIYNFASNIGNGIISTYISLSSTLEVEYNYEISKAVTLKNGAVITPKIIFTLVLKNPEYPSIPNLVPVNIVKPYTVYQLTETDKIILSVGTTFVAIAILITIIGSGGLTAPTAPATMSAGGLVITNMLTNGN